jgi:hypothetical protein
MRENWYRRVLFVGMGVWGGGILAIAYGVGAVGLDLGPWWAAVAIALLSGVVGGIAGGRTTYDRSVPDRIHGPVGVALFVGVPVAFLVVVLAYLVLVPSPTDAITSVLFAGAVSSTVGGFVVLVANLPLWKATVQSSSTAYASWSARQPPTKRRRNKYAAGVLVVLGVGYLGAPLLFNLSLDSEMTNWWVVLAPLTALFASVENEREVEVRDGGLLMDTSLVAWDDLDAVELTDQALVLHRASRFFERADRFDREDIDDLDGAVDALARFLKER